jgi:formylglycine-generating enzyme required for sulfatase activity/cephalosporin-C deacetylase-like acetyl esterase
VVGQTISHYRILEKLGGGGMGVVYKAIDVRLNRFVALKFLSPDLTRDDDAKQRFMHEAQAASALDHPNICTIHEIDETAEGELFLTLAYYDGESLKHRLQRGPLPIDDAIDIAAQVAQALARAHQSGIVHRDIKPANLMLPNDGPVKIVDFGLAKLVGHSELTKTGTTVGTVAYMSPEQIRGAEAGPPADVWATGVVFYEMLAGTRPFTGKDDLAVISCILDDAPRPIRELRPDTPDDASRILAKALQKPVVDRYPSAVELFEDLSALQAKRRTAGPAPPGLLRGWRGRVALAIAALLVAAAAVPAVRAYREAARVRWARDVGIPQITQYVAKDDYAAAFAVASEVERYAPDDPVLKSLWPQFAAQGSFNTEPAGAEVYVQPYASTDATWQRLGRTPIGHLRLPRGAFRFRVEKDGFEPPLLAANNPGPLFQQGPRRQPPLTIPLQPKNETPGMVLVPGGAFPVGLTGFNSDVGVTLPTFTIDRNEITNREFQKFVDGGGYANGEVWRSMLVDAGAFVDATGRPGPAGWELGRYPAGQEAYPVSGVSWYEAVAYCRSVGKELPTIYHWGRAALSPAEVTSPLAPAIIPLSNFAGKGPAPAGTYRGVGPYGTNDMAGNVREWVWNEAPDHRRWILGGASNDADYMFNVPASAPPADRSTWNGFRCVRYAPDARPDASLLAAVATYTRDHRAAKAVSDEVYEVFRRQYAHLKSPLNERVEDRDTRAPDWIRERVTFDAGYEPGRVTVYLFVPRHSPPPYQLVVFFPGVGPFAGRLASTNLQPLNADYIVKSGRALVYPIYKGSFERWDPFTTLQGDDYLQTFRTRMGQWRQDLARTLDVMTARPDIDRERIAYFGASFGASTALPLVALEERLKAAILAPAGFTYRELPPEADAINYLSHITIPVLMLGGSHDYIFPLETAQKPFFDRLGTPVDHKRFVVADAGHTTFPRSQLIRETLAFLDRYLGPVKSAAPTQ